MNEEASIWARRLAREEGILGGNSTRRQAMTIV
jgi:hypothetical protein